MPCDFATERRGRTDGRRSRHRLRERGGDFAQDSRSHRNPLRGLLRTRLLARAIGADGQGATLLVVVTDEMEDEIAASLIEQCSQRGMRTVMLRSFEHSPQASDADIVVPESMDNWCLGLALVVVGQVLSLRLGELRGRPIDTSPGLNKVTLTA